MRGEMRIFGLSVAAQPKTLRTEEDRRHSSSVSVSLPYHHTHLNPQPGLSRDKDVFGRLYGSSNFVWIEKNDRLFCYSEKKRYFLFRDQLYRVMKYTYI